MKESILRINSKNVWLAVIVVAAAVGLYVGWRLFWFMTDDAMIAFRYVSNSMLGYGYVWNAPPFRPVEGYTSFLWIVIMEYIWRWFGMEPPAIANTVALIFSYATLFLSIWMFMRLSLNERLARFRLIFLALGLMGILTNRTYLAWTSSGLETALFNFCITLWIFIAVFARRRDSLWLIGLTTTAALAHLTRPDGLLILLSTAALVGHRLIDLRQEGGLTLPRLASISPALIPIAHLLWRHSFYGEWLPNTYYAKYVEAWPEAGLRYLASFILEYGLWVWVGGLVGVIVVWYRRQPERMLQSWRSQIDKTVRALLPASSSGDGRRFAILVVVGTIAAHIGYYTLLIGGDHFEYRVYSYLVPLIFLSSVWMINRLFTDGLVAACVLALFIVLSWPIQWTHWLITKDFSTRGETWMMREPIAPAFPGPVRWYADAFDQLQYWLIERHVCMRHQEHKVFYEYMTAEFPPRSLTVPTFVGQYPIAAFQSVGVPGWVFARSAILDAFGLNDYVIARNTDRPRHIRYMAHDRMPPRWYLESFSLNFGMFASQSPVHSRREFEITAEEIITTEQFWIDRIVYGRVEPFSYSMMNRIGETLIRGDRIDSALVCLKQALSMDQTQVRAYVNIAFCFIKNEMPDSAQYYLLIAEAREPNNPLVLTRLGRAYAAEGYDQNGVDQARSAAAFATAERYLNRAHSINPSRSEALVELASMYLFVNRLDSSMAYLNSLESVEDISPDELRLLGDRYVFRKHRDLAIRSFRLAIKHGLKPAIARVLVAEYPELSEPRSQRPVTN